MTCSTRQCRRRQGDALQLRRARADHRFRPDARLPRRRPGSCRCSTASLAILCMTVLLWPTAGSGAAQVQGASFGARAAAAVGLPLEPDRGRSRSSRCCSAGWSRSRCCSATSAMRRSFNAILLLLEMLSIIVFVGGFAVMLWNAYRRGAANGAGRARCGASCWSSPPDGPLRRPGLQADRLDDQLLMAGSASGYRVETTHLSAPFRISGFVFETSDVVVVELTDGEFTGRGEAAGVYYLGDDSPHMVAEIEAHRDAIEAGASREELRELMPPGGARNAVDCALWDLEAKRAGQPARRLAGVDEPKPLVTTFTLGADEPEAMAEGARALRPGARDQGEADRRARARHRARVAAVRAARPDVWLGVDANQGFTPRRLDALVQALVDSPRLAARAAAEARPRGRSRGLPVPDPDRRRRKRAWRWTTCRPRRPLRRHQHQARQMRRADRGAADGRRGAPPRARGDGRQHGRHQPGHGAGVRRRPALRRRRPRRADLPSRRPQAASCEYRDGTIWCPDEVWGSRAAA